MLHYITFYYFRGVVHFLKKKKGKERSFRSSWSVRKIAPRANVEEEGAMATMIEENGPSTHVCIPLFDFFVLNIIVYAV